VHAEILEPSLMRWDVVPVLLLALLATCLVASSHYVLNEMLDAPYDRKHPEKHGPPREKVRLGLAGGSAGAAGLTPP
jgi:4-hydroxybenzoate polyprenyltransferase